MTQSMIGYDPRASLFKKKNSRGFSFYINYYLPNGVRVRRLCGPTREVSLRRMRIKERELLDGIFEDSDLEKMPLERFEPQRKKRLEIIEGVEIYLEMTRNKRRPRTQQAEQVKLKKNFSYFSGKGLSFLDEISHVEAQRWVNLLEDKGYREATVKSYVTLMSKVFNYFIETSGEIQGRNPFGRVSISRKGTLVRDHLPTDDEVRRILSARLPENSGHTVPIEDIVRFAVFTGARVSEILHAEWGDFDLDEGVWRIRIKPDCPTAEGLGWQPKWGKPREVHLFEEALEVLQRRLRSRPPRDRGPRPYSGGWRSCCIEGGPSLPVRLLQDLQEGQGYCLSGLKEGRQPQEGILEAYGYSRGRGGHAEGPKDLLQSSSGKPLRVLEQGGLLFDRELPGGEPQTLRSCQSLGNQE